MAEFLFLDFGNNGSFIPKVSCQGDDTVSPGFSGPGEVTSREALGTCQKYDHVSTTSEEGRRRLA